MTVGEKKCTRCGKIKPLDIEHWKRNKKSRDGWQWQCRECQIEIRRARRAKHRAEAIASGNGPSRLMPEVRDTCIMCGEPIERPRRAYCSVQCQKRYQHQRDTEKRITGRAKGLRDDISDLEGEEWRSIPGFEGEYEVSNLGRVKSIGRFRLTKKGMHYPVKTCLLKQSVRKGYSSVGLPKNGKYKRLRVNRLVAIAFIENPDGKPYVNHIDGNKQNNCADNLEWVTAKENRQHAIRTGLAKNGKPVVREDGKRFPSILSAAISAGMEHSTMKYHIVKGTPVPKDGLVYKFAD